MTTATNHDASPNGATLPVVSREDTLSRQLEEQIETNAELVSENAGLRNELAEYRARVSELEAQEVVVVTPDMRKAIESIRHTMRPQDDQKLINYVACMFNAVYKRDHLITEAIKTVEHAGLEYLAYQIDWARVLTRYGSKTGAEAAELVESLSRATRESEVERVIEDWEAE